MKGFKDIIGNDILKEQFSGAIRTGSISHAYMLSGDRGMGKKRFARAFCQELFCEHPVDGNPCGICPSCKRWRAAIIRMSYGSGQKSLRS